VAKVEAFLKSLTGKMPAHAYLPEGEQIPDRTQSDDGA
jgi:hypothetical protein